MMAQSPSALVRRLDSRRTNAQRAVAQAVAAERQLQTLPARPGTVAVIAGASPAGDLHALGGGIADLLATDLASVHALRVVERMQAQAIVTELARDGVDEWSRPRAWRVLGAADIVVVDAQVSGTSLRLSARVVNLARARVDATVAQAGTLDGLFDAERRLALDVMRTLGVEPTAAERRMILDRPAAKIDAFLAWSAALDAIESGDAPQAERLLQRALDADPGVNAAFDAGLLASAGLAGLLGGVVPMPGAASAAGDDPTDAGLATEGNESEYGEAWFEGSGDRRLSLYEMAVPLSASMALGRGRFDLSTIWSSNRADTPANDVFHAWGFTDVHARYTHPLGRTGASLTVGGAFPVRNVHGVDDDIRRVPLPPDLLPSAMYQRRNAPSLSAGLFFTRTTGAWSWGGAGGGEWNASYDELNPSLHTVAVAPGMRYRVRADAERSWGPGRLALGGSLLALSPAKRAGVAVRGGSRSFGRASYAWPVGRIDLETGAWLLHASAVTSAGAPVRSASDIVTYFANARTRWRGWTLDGGVDVKRWTAGGANAADLLVPQVGLTHPISRVLMGEIGADYVSGHFHEAPSTNDIPVRGWMLRAGLRIEP